MKKKTGLHIVKATALLGIIAAWISIPYLTGKAESLGAVPIVVRTANLVSPTGSIDPHGAAEWQLYASGHREIEVEIEDVHSLPAGTSLNAVVDGAVIGQVVLAVDERGRLKLRTEDGQQVPTVNDGSTVEVRNGNTILVAGVFGGGGPTPTPSVSPTASPTGTPNGTPSPSPSPTGTPTGTPSPSPSPTGTPNAGDLFAGLTGPTLNGVVPRGFSQFEIHSSRLELDTRIRQVNLPGGTMLNVVVDNIAVGNLILESDGEGELRLRTDRGQTVPNVVAGSTIVVRNGQTTILSGVFAGMTGPTPSPSPSPSASPTPTQGRSFETHLLGSGMAPPVTTNATGEIKVTLNAAETQAVIFGEFHNLGSNQTGARIETTAGSGAVIRDLGVVGGLNGNFASTTIDVTAAQVQQLRAGLWTAVITSVNNPAGEIRGTFRQRSSGGDLDGDGSNDLAVFRPSSSTWYAQNSDGFTASVFGGADDKVVSGDYDGDGRTDVAVFKNVNGSGVWEIKRSSDGGIGTVQYGYSTDIPARGDFDGDGRFDIAVFRPSTGVWYIQKSDNSGATIVQFGLSEDKPTPMDVDGDGRDDMVVWRPSNGVWYWLRSSDGQFGAAQFGLSGDIPVRADIDGDGKDDPTVFRPSTGVWYSLRSNGGFYAVQWGVSEDVPVPGDYDNDGRTDLVVFRPSTGVWHVLRSSDGGYHGVQFGLTGDIPLLAR